jgi:hypothetical protein
VHKSVLFIIFAFLSFIVVPTAGYSVEGKVNWQVVSLDVVGSTRGENVYRGDFFTVTAQLKNNTASKPGPLKVRIYLSSSRDGTTMQHEFDIFHDIVLDKPGTASAVKHEFDSFHDVLQDKLGNVSVTGRYIIPYTVDPGDTYWVVFEVSPEGKVVQGMETKTIRVINVPCDENVLEYNTNNCGDRN